MTFRQQALELREELRRIFLFLDEVRGRLEEIGVRLEAPHNLKQICLTFKYHLVTRRS